MTEDGIFGRQSILGTKTCWAGMNPGCQTSISTHFVSCAAAVDAVGWVAKEDRALGTQEDWAAGCDHPVSPWHGWLTASSSCPHSSKKRNWLRLEEEVSFFSFREVLEQNRKLGAREVSHPWQGCEKPVPDLWINQSPFLSAVMISKPHGWAGKPSGYWLFHK